MEEKYYAGQTAIAAPPEPALAKLHQAVARLEKADSQVSDIASRLAGSVPEKASNGASISPVSNGVFDLIEDAARHINTLADSISGNMQRIANRL